MSNGAFAYNFGDAHSVSGDGHCFGCYAKGCGNSLRDTRLADARVLNEVTVPRSAVSPAPATAGGESPAPATTPVVSRGARASVCAHACVGEQLRHFRPPSAYLGMLFIALGFRKLFQTH